MSDDLIQRIETARVRAAEDMVIASIPKDLRDRMEKANAEFAAKGGCTGCGSKRIAVHDAACPKLDDDCY